MAWAEKLPGGKWRGGWRLPDGTTKCYTKKVTHPEHPYRLKSDALDAAQEAEVRAARQASVGTGTLSATTKWGEWWDLGAEARAARATDTDKAELYIVRNYLRPRWGETALNDIRHKSVQRWLDSLVDGTCPQWVANRERHRIHGRGRPAGPTPEPSYVRRIYATFKGSLQRAVDEEVLSASPCVGHKLPKLRRKRKVYLTLDDSAKLGKVLRPDYQDALDEILETGLRPNELCGLHADRIDWDRKRVDVDMVLVSRRRVIRAFPKDKDARQVPLTDTAVAILRRRLDGRTLTGGCGVPHADGSRCDSVLVFLTERGRPMRVHALGDRLRYAAKVHDDVPKRTPYSGRRGFATRAARGGADAFAIAEVMGHADVEQTQEYVQNERIGPVIRAALGDREPLAVVQGTSSEDAVDTLRQGAVQSGHDGAMDHRTGS